MPLLPPSSSLLPSGQIDFEDSALGGTGDERLSGAEGAPQETSRRVLQPCTTLFPCGSAVAGTGWVGYSVAGVGEVGRTGEGGEGHQWRRGSISASFLVPKRFKTSWNVVHHEF